MAIIICIISGIFWSLFDVSRKLTLEKISSISLLIIFSIAQILIFFIWVILDGFRINIKIKTNMSIANIFIDTINNDFE